MCLLIIKTKDALVYYGYGLARERSKFLVFELIKPSEKNIVANRKWTFPFVTVALFERQ